MSEHQPNIVVIGGGTAQPIILNGLKDYAKHISAIVTATDAGSSTGILREELDILPPGDIQKCLVALAQHEELLHELFSFRFAEGTLKNHSFGNLFLAALTKKTGSFEQAIVEAAKILNVEGKVYPSTLDNIHLHAELTNGKICTSEPAIESTAKGEVKKLFLSDPNAQANPGAVQAIKDANIILIGPGSLFTSILPNILVKGITQALQQTKAKVVYMCNLVTQPGETDGLSAKGHVLEIEKYLGKNVLDVVLVNNHIPSRAVLERYQHEDQMPVDLSDLNTLPNTVVQADLIQDVVVEDLLHEKANVLRHDPRKVILTLNALQDTWYAAQTKLVQK